MYEKIVALIKELEALSDETREYVLATLMYDGKIDYVSLSKWYVRYLEGVKQDYWNKIVEAGTCIAEHLIEEKHKSDKGRKSKQATLSKENTIQRSLYFLNNQYKGLATDDLNEHFHYDNEKAKKLSWYERNKESN